MPKRNIYNPNYYPQSKTKRFILQNISKPSLIIRKNINNYPIISDSESLDSPDSPDETGELISPNCGFSWWDNATDSADVCTDGTVVLPM
jgi:hypothetical protein